MGNEKKKQEFDTADNILFIVYASLLTPMILFTTVMIIFCS